LTPQAIKSAKLPSTAIGTAIEGGIFGLGADLEQGSSGKNTLLGAGIGGALPYVGAGLSKAFGKTTSKGAGKVPEVIPETKVKTPTAKPVTEEVIPTTKTVKANEVPVKVTPEQPKLPETEYNNAKSKIDNSFVDYKDYDRAEEFVGKDPEYITQTVKGREISGLESIRTKGKDNAIKEALGINPISPDAGYTASSIKETLIKSGLLTDDEVARLLRSKAVESFAGSSLQSVSPLQSFMNKANEAIKKTYQNKIVANKKTVRSLFEGLEC
jgi:hypothetical protein